MAEVIINGITVCFPFEPYEVQKNYMSKVLECLQKGVHGVLESPTGTGKTLSLLCSSLAWLQVKKAQIQSTIQATVDPANPGSGLPEQQQQPGNELLKQLAEASGVTATENQLWYTIFGTPKIIYASRTHSQLGQVIAELKRTKYAHFKVAVLGSRDQMCLHPEVSKETNAGLKVALCRMKVSARTCHYYNNVDLKKLDPVFSEIMDIEDLVTKSRKHQCCPYYMSREVQKKADIIFVPYNYLLDPHIRKIMDIQLNNNIVILDEAHNVEKMCEESASFEVTSTDIALCITEVTQVMKEMHDHVSSGSFDESGSAPDFSAEDLCILKALFTELEDAIDKINLNSGNKSCGLDPSNVGAAFPGSYIFEILAKAEVTPDKLPILSGVIHNVAQYLITVSGTSFQNRGTALKKFEDLLKVISSSLGVTKDLSRTDKYYKVFIEPEVSKKNKYEGRDKKPVKVTAKRIHFWCFNAGCGMTALVEQGVRCVILTSGTLAPLDATISEIGIPVGVRLENPHIIGENQVCVSVVAKGPTNTELKSTYENRNKSEYLRELALTLQNFSRVIPEGLLVFFPSYPTMEKAISFWQEEGLWTKINSNKPIFVEPQRKDALNEVINKYYEKLVEANSKGSILLAVCRGKVSEGFDFADYKGRAVLITGLPYPPFKDPRVVLKRAYIDQNKSDRLSLTGMEWYQLEATRAVNQAVGRVIRHSKDFGAILLCDSRFGDTRMTKSLSKWLQPHIKNCSHFRFAYANLVSFFRNVGPLLPAKRLSNPGASFSYATDVKIHELKSTAKNDSFNREETRSLFEQFTKMQKSNQSLKKNESKPKNKPTDLLEALSEVEQQNFNASVSTQTSNTSNNEVQTMGFLPSFLTGFLKKLSPTSSKDPENSSNSVLMKKRLLQNQFEVPSSPSANSSFVEMIDVDSSSPLYGSLKKRKISVNKVASYNDEAESPTTSNAPPDIDITNMKIVAYMTEIKKVLKPTQFLKFKAGVINYKVNKDYDEMLSLLQEVLPLSNKETHNLFKAFSLYLLQPHKLLFKEFCEQHIK